MAETTHTRRLWLAAAIACLFVFRLSFGLSREFFFEDETQIFLMGLRYYATGAWPYFGPDVVWTKSEIPGALQALLVGLPLKAFAVPEAPFILLNGLSTAALALWCWYVCRRLPTLPRWLVWGYFMTLPWTTQFSTHVINPSYVLPASIVFFLGFFEAVPSFGVGVISCETAFFLMGSALVWIMQIHMSWPLLLPYVGFAWLARAPSAAAPAWGWGPAPVSPAWGWGPAPVNDVGWLAGTPGSRRSLATTACAFALGTLAPGMLLVPTVLKYGVHAGAGGTFRNLDIHPVGLPTLTIVAARFLSFACLEISRFIATDTAKRLSFFQRHLWLAPLAAAIWAIGVVQPLWMVREWFRRTAPYPEWRLLRLLVSATVLVVYASYWFVLEPNQAHAFYVVAPVAFMFAAYCWTFLDSAAWRTRAATMLVCNVAFAIGLAWAQAPEQSLYKNRTIVASAIRLRQPEMLAHRRPFAIDSGPATLQDPSRPYDARRDIHVVKATYRIGLGGMVLWDIRIDDVNDKVAFRDVLYYTSYFDEAGRLLEQRHEFVKDIFEPGQTRDVEINDGFVQPAFAQARFEIAAAEALIPAPPKSPPAGVPSAAAAMGVGPRAGR